MILLPKLAGPETNRGLSREKQRIDLLEDGGEESKEEEIVPQKTEEERTTRNAERATGGGGEDDERARGKRVWDDASSTERAKAWLVGRNSKGKASE